VDGACFVGVSVDVLDGFDRFEGDLPELEVVLGGRLAVSPGHQPQLRVRVQREISGGRQFQDELGRSPVDREIYTL